MAWHHVQVVMGATDAISRKGHEVPLLYPACKSWVRSKALNLFEGFIAEFKFNAEFNRGRQRKNRELKSKKISKLAGLRDFAKAYD